MAETTQQQKTASATCKVLFCIVLVFACIGCDQVSKRIAQKALPGKGTVSVLGDVVVLVYAENRGAFLSLGSGFSGHERLLFIILIPAVAVIGMSIYIALRLRTITVATLAALSLFIGGGIGNLIDRVFRGIVIDFINIGIGGLRTGILNLADLYVFFGLITLSLDYFMNSRKKQPNTKKADDIDP